MADTNYPSYAWRTIPFAPDYAVADTGDIWRIAERPAYRRGLTLKPKIRADGYPEVTLISAANLTSFSFIGWCAACFTVSAHKTRMRWAI